MTFLDPSAPSVDMSMDLDRSKLYGIRRPTATPPVVIPVPQTARDSSLAVRPRSSDVKNTNSLRHSKSLSDGIDQLEAPKLINLFSEYYKFQLTARAEQRAPARPPEPALIPILMTGWHPPQTERVVHFHPAPGDVIPKNAILFDYNMCMNAYNDKKMERQEFALWQAAMLCDPPPPKSTRKPTTQTSSQRMTPRTSFYDRSQAPKQPVRGTLFVRPNSAPVRRKRETTVDENGITESLMIRKVIVGPTKRPRSDTAPVRKMRAPKRDHEQPERRTPQKRYRSPPPRAARFSNATNSSEAPDGDFTIGMP